MVTITEIKKAKCEFSGKDCEGVVATFADGSFTDIFVSWQTLKQLCALKAKESKKATK